MRRCNLRIDIDNISLKIDENNFMKNLIGELNKSLEKFRKNDKIGNKSVKNMKLTESEDKLFEKRKDSFLKKYFEKELSDLSKGEIFWVTNKYENDYKYHRYKVTQYVDNLICKHVVFSKDLPENIKLGDIVRKVDEKYIYDKQATKYVRNSLNKIKQG